MQDKPFEPEALVSRASTVAQEIRKSEAYPAVIGGIAGGIAGGLIAALIAGRVAGSRGAAGSVDSEGDVRVRKASRGFNLRDLVQLATVAATLAKQVNAWYREQKQV